MCAQARRNVSGSDHDARLHVFLKCVPGQVGAGQKSYIPVGDSHFSVNPSFGER